MTELISEYWILIRIQRTDGTGYTSVTGTSQSWFFSWGWSPVCWSEWWYIWQFVTLLSWCLGVRDVGRATPASGCEDRVRQPVPQCWPTVRTELSPLSVSYHRPGAILGRSPPTPPPSPSPPSSGGRKGRRIIIIIISWIENWKMIGSLINLHKHGGWRGEFFLF